MSGVLQHLQPNSCSNIDTHTAPIPRNPYFVAVKFAVGCTVHIALTISDHVVAVESTERLANLDTKPASFGLSDNFRAIDCTDGAPNTGANPVAHTGPNEKSNGKANGEPIPQADHHTNRSPFGITDARANGTAHPTTFCVADHGANKLSDKVAIAFSN